MQIGERTMVAIQDSKQLQKTTQNNLFTGAKALILGSHMICFQQIWEIESLPDSRVTNRYARCQETGQTR